MAQLVECMPSLQEALSFILAPHKPGLGAEGSKVQGQPCMLAHTINLSTWKA